jgi:hypothetical protein
LRLVSDLDTVTGPFAYIRLLETALLWIRVVIDRGEQIQADAQAIRLLSQRVPVLAFVNNHFAGYAPETIRSGRSAGFHLGLRN